MYPVSVSTNLEFYLQPAYLVSKDCKRIIASNGAASVLKKDWANLENQLLQEMKSMDLPTQMIEKKIVCSDFTTGNTGFSTVVFPADDQHYLVLVGNSPAVAKNSAQTSRNYTSIDHRFMLDSSSHIIWAIDIDFHLTYFNKKYQQRVEERYGQTPVLGQLAPELKFVDLSVNRDKWMQYYSLVWQNRKLHFEISFKDEQGKEVWEDIFLNPIYNSENEIIGASAFSQTVTYKKQAERKIKDQTAKINSIFNSTAMLIWTMDKDMRVTSYNNNFAKRLREICETEVSIGGEFLDFVKPVMTSEALQKAKILFSEALQGDIKRLESRLDSKSGNQLWIELFINPIYMESGRIREISCIAHNITDKKIIEKQINDSLHEKEVLLQEVHHRVKNNLQVISSILNLQTSYVKDKNTLDILRESQNRIRSMSFIHESLYQTKDFSSIDFSDYIFGLAKNLIHSYSIGTANVKLTTDIEKVVLNLDQAIPCGLILNELISNALKYAFPEPNSEGIIHLSIHSEGKFILIEVSDNGIGLPENFSIEKSDALGLQLVYTLAEQLDAKVDFNSKNGTRYLIKFAKQ